MVKPLDIVLFGASGCTGSHCIESLHKLTKANSTAFTWGIAGRSEKKLKHALQEYEKEIGEDLSSIPIIVADVNDFESLKKMTASAKVVINCCGPYEFYGEPVVRACIETGTHQVDLTAEAQYMAMIEYKYSKACEETGIYIVSACGFGSVCADFGVLFLQDKFEGTINSVESYLLYFEGGEGTGINLPTFVSVINAFTAKSEIEQLEQKLHRTRLSEFRPKLKSRFPLHKSDLIQKWCVPFIIGADEFVVQRTQRYLFENEANRPIQMRMYYGSITILEMLYKIPASLSLLVLSRFKFGRSLLFKYPSFFTSGMVKSTPPVKSAQRLTKFEMTLTAVGWSEKLAGVSEEFKTPPNKKMVACLKAYDPGYTLTGDIATLSALVILNELDKLPKRGGWYTPGMAFQKTSLLKQLQETGLTVELP